VAVLEIRYLIAGQTDISFILTLPVVIGFFVAMIACYISIKIMLKIVAAGKLQCFSYYLNLFGCVDTNRLELYEFCIWGRQETSLAQTMSNYAGSNI